MGDAILWDNTLDVTAKFGRSCAILLSMAMPVLALLAISVDEDSLEPHLSGPPLATGVSFPLQLSSTYPAQEVYACFGSHFHSSPWAPLPNTLFKNLTSPWLLGPTTCFLRSSFFFSGSNNH